ncbi:Ubiquinone biosynthesis monooxygenase COQ6 [Trichinella sp. T8]|nr:Ubiquinone biosynthesis monooxygenase COQ6 [Trichinella sp. T8]
MAICQFFANRSRLWFSKINKYCTSRKDYDVVIIGGGMVGQAMACCIGTNPVLKALSVLLVDVGKPVKYEMSKHYSNRIAADGSNSRIRSAMGVRTLQWNYDQKSIIANLKLIYANPEDSCTAWQRFVRTGPLAVLPLSNDQASLSWSCDDEFARKLMDMSETDFVDSLNIALCDQSSQNVVTNSTLDLMDTFFENVCNVKNRPTAIVPPTVVGVEKRAAIPLSLVQPAHYVDHRVALIGDSAHRIHPLAGQGVNLGYADVQELANVIENAMMAGCDIGSMLHLREYETRRQREVIPIAFGCDALKKLYSHKFSPIVLARSLGVNFIEKSPFLKVRLHPKRTFTNIVNRPQISV